MFALGGLALLAGAGLTASAYTDEAVLNMGTGTAGSGVGDPRRFDIAILDEDGNQQDAPDEASAVVLPVTGSVDVGSITPGIAPGIVLSELVPVGFEAGVVNRDSSIAGDLLLRVFDPDPGPNDPWDSLLFTVHLDGDPTAAITDAPPAGVDAADLGFTDVAPGEEHRMRFSIRLAPGTAAGHAGQSTQVGVRVDGESR